MPQGNFGVSLSVTFVSLFTDEGEECQLPGTLDGGSQRALVTGTGACLAARPDFTFFSRKTTQHVGLFVINLNVLIGAELADLRSSYVPTPHGLFGFHIHII